MSETEATTPVAEPDDVQMVPSVSGGLLLRDTVTSQTSLKGVGDTLLHPLIDGFLREIPVEHREMFRFNCAEPMLVSERLAEFEAERPGDEPLTWDDAVEYCTGGTIFTRLVRAPGDPEHGDAVLPCKSCAQLLSALGIEVLES
jgi:hypothetical protein